MPNSSCHFPYPKGPFWNCVSVLHWAIKALFNLPTPSLSLTISRHKFYLYPSSSTCPPSYSLHLAPHVSVHAMSSTWYTLPPPPLHKSKSQLSFNPSMASFVIFPLMTEAHNDSTTHLFWIPILLHSTQWYTPDRFSSECSLNVPLCKSHLPN